MSNVLVAYTTNSGSTAEVAEVVAGALRQKGHSVDIKECSSVGSLAAYDSVVIGAPMIIGWHSAARRFIRKHRVELTGRKVAYFACALSLTRTPAAAISTIPLTLDPGLVKDPARPGRINLHERFTTIDYYLKPMLSAATEVKPLGVAFFNGKLETYRLKWWQAVFVMVVVRAVPGDYRDFEVIKGWAEALAL
jgi:menaquinone-dependent protoporphyrinogen IX oxidase